MTSYYEAQIHDSEINLSKTPHLRCWAVDCYGSTHDFRFRLRFLLDWRVAAKCRGCIRYTNVINLRNLSSKQAVALTLGCIGGAVVYRYWKGKIYAEIIHFAGWVRGRECHSSFHFHVVRCVRHKVSKLQHAGRRV